MWQGTVTPSRRRTPGSIPGSPTIINQSLTSCIVLQIPDCLGLVPIPGPNTLPSHTIPDASEQPLKGPCGLPWSDNTVDWQAAPKQTNSHLKEMKTLQRFRALQWSPAWKNLNKLVVETGTTISKNPVPKILAWNPGCDPIDLSLAWAQKIDKDLRSTLINAPHGRADLAITLANQLALFDKLHDVASVSASGLLPERIGNIRQKTAA